MSDKCATCGAADVILFTCGYCGREFCADHDLPHHSCEGFAHPGEGVEQVTFEWETGGRTDPEDAFTESGFRPATGGGETATQRPAPRAAPEATARAVEPVPRRTEAATTAAVRPTPRPTGDDATPAVEPLPRRVERTTTPAATPAPRPVERATPAVERAPRAVTGATDPAVRPAPRRPAIPEERAVRPAPDPEPEPDPASPGTTPTGTPTTAADVSAAATPGDQSAPGHIRTMDAKRSPGSVERHEPRTLTEWLDQQTYVSLSVKTAALATVINGALYLGMMVTLYGLLPV